MAGTGLRVLTTQYRQLKTQIRLIIPPPQKKTRGMPAFYKLFTHQRTLALLRYHSVYTPFIFNSSH